MQDSNIKLMRSSIISVKMDSDFIIVIYHEQLPIDRFSIWSKFPTNGQVSRANAVCRQFTSIDKACRHTITSDERGKPPSPNRCRVTTRFPSVGNGYSKFGVNQNSLGRVIFRAFIQNQLSFIGDKDFSTTSTNLVIQGINDSIQPRS